MDVTGSTVPDTSKCCADLRYIQIQHNANTVLERTTTICSSLNPVFLLPGACPDTLGYAGRPNPPPPGKPGSDSLLPWVGFPRSDLGATWVPTFPQEKLGCWSASWMFDILFLLFIPYLPIPTRGRFVNNRP